MELVEGVKTWGWGRHAALGVDGGELEHGYPDRTKRRQTQLGEAVWSDVSLLRRMEGKSSTERLEGLPWSSRTVIAQHARPVDLSRERMPYTSAEANRGREAAHGDCKA